MNFWGSLLFEESSFFTSSLSWVSASPPADDVVVFSVPPQQQQNQPRTELQSTPFYRFHKFTTLCTSEAQSRVIQKLGQVSKIRLKQSWILLPCLSITGHLLIHTLNNERDRLWKRKNLVTWPWPWVGKKATCHMAQSCVALIDYILDINSPKLDKPRKTICKQTDAEMHISVADWYY